MTLPEFLLARIAEDEARARRHISSIVDRNVVVYATRVLADCEAKRRIVEGFSVDCRPVLRILATVYADHPDYREEWRP